MQRYSISVVGKLAYEIDGAETPSGDWCRAQDVVALEAHVAELETAVAALKALAESLQERLAAAEAYIDALLRMQAAVRVVADESEGIAGWHQNGELAKWDELLPEIFDEYADKSGERVMNNIDELWSEMVAKAKLSLDINWMVTEDEVLVKIAERLAAAEATTRTEPVRNIDKIRSLVTELRDCRKRGLGELWDLCETAADQIEAIVAGDWS